MSILLVFENKNVTPWVKALTEKLPETIIEVYPDVKDKSAVDFLICWKPNKNLIDEFPNIKVIQSVGASIDHITNTQKVNNKHIITRIVDEKLSNDMWEFLLAVVLSQLKKTKTYFEQQINKEWKQHDYMSIKNTTISILGLGKIGSFVAEKFAEVGFKVKGWSSSLKEINKVKSYEGKSELNTFLMDTNFLINILPLTKQTEGILNKNLFKKLPCDSFIINVGRGEHLIEDDLIESLNNLTISGALLDVFKTEPLPKEHVFWNHPKIQITPHIASLTNVISATEQIVENYKLFMNNEELQNIVSLKKGY